MTTPAPEPPLDGLVSVTGTLLLPDGTPDSGTVRMSVASTAILRDADPAPITAAALLAAVSALLPAAE